MNEREMLETIGFGETETITATCGLCGYSEDYQMDESETATLILYQQLGRQMGYLQELFPKVPAWIRAGAIDQMSNGFCICPKCGPF